MKRILFVLTVTGLMASCGGGDKKEGGEKMDNAEIGRAHV